MFLVLIACIVLATLFTISSEGFSAKEYREQNQMKYTNYELINMAFDDYKRILDLKL